jgi:hypothetical protein
LGYVLRLLCRWIGHNHKYWNKHPGVGGPRQGNRGFRCSRCGADTTEDFNPGKETTARWEKLRRLCPWIGHNYVYGGEWFCAACGGTNYHDPLFCGGCGKLPVFGQRKYWCGRCGVRYIEKSR